PRSPGEGHGSPGYGRSRRRRELPRRTGGLSTHRPIHPRAVVLSTVVGGVHHLVGAVAARGGGRAVGRIRLRRRRTHPHRGLGADQGHHAVVPPYGSTS